MYFMWLSDEEQRIWRDYLALVSQLQAAMSRQLQQDCGLSLSDYDVLVPLSERGPQRMYQLAATLGWEQSRVSHQLRRMRGRGLVERHGSPADRRGATVEITAAGRSALEAAAPGHVRLVREVLFEGMTRDQRRAFGAVLGTALQRLHQDVEREDVER
jgi:DNA-binding MarR family transcriptional regulator